MGAVSLLLRNISDVEERKYTIDIPGDVSLFDMLSTWSEENAPGLTKRVFDPETGDVSGTMMVIKNGRSVKSEDPRVTIVSPGDEITVFPIIVGG